MRLFACGPRPTFLAPSPAQPPRSVGRIGPTLVAGLITFGSLARGAHAEPYAVPRVDAELPTPVLGPAAPSEPVRVGPTKWTLTSCHPAIGKNSWPLTALAVEFDPTTRARQVQLQIQLQVQPHEAGTATWSLTPWRPPTAPAAPTASRPRAGHTWWAALPTPAFASCVTLSWSAKPIRGASVSATASDSQAPVHPIVRWYTELDEGEPAQKFLHALRTWPNWHAHAPAVLGAIHAPYRAVFVQAIHAQWSSLTLPEQERAMLVYERWAPHDAAPRAALAALAMDERSPHERRAVTALLHAGPTSSAELLRVVARRPSLWTRLNAPLAHRAPEATLRALWAHIEEPLTRQVPAARRGLLLATDELHAQAMALAEVEALWSSWLATQPSVAAVAFAGQAFNHSRHWLPLQQRLVDYALTKAASPRCHFECRWRLLLAIRSMPSMARYEGWVTTQALHAPEWMTRNAALETLRDHARPGARTTASALLEDPYPRVRITAAELLRKRIDAPALPFVTIAAPEATTPRSQTRPAK